MFVESTTSARFNLARVIGARVRTVRLESRWSQRELASRLGASQAAVSRLESGRTRDIHARLASKALEVLGIRVLFDGQTLGLAGRREQRDLVHSACAGYVARRLARTGWRVRPEVEIGEGRSRGWIDLLAFRDVDRSVLVIEVKTEILEVGAIQRAIGWYEREAWTAARRQGWRPRAVTSALILLGSEENDARVQSNGSVLKVSFPASGTQLASWVDQATGRALPRAIATVDPRSRGTVWLRSTRSDGRRRSATYRDYADAAQRLLRR